MIDPLETLRRRARQLQKQVEKGDERALARIKRHPEIRTAPEDQVSQVTRRRHCLSVVAGEYGFSGWGHLKRVVDGATDGDFGTGMYRSGYWNIWSASYDEARTIRQEHGGFLLPYKTQFVIVDQYFIENLGLDPDDPDWEAVGRDWVRPSDPAARRRLYGKLFEMAREN